MDLSKGNLKDHEYVQDGRDGFKESPYVVREFPSRNYRILCL